MVLPVQFSIIKSKLSYRFSFYYFYLTLISSRRQQERISSLRRQKQQFVPGFWNINTIKMGGLGREPELNGMLFFSIKNIDPFMNMHYLVSKKAWVLKYECWNICVSERNPEEEIQDAVSSCSLPHNIIMHFCFPLISALSIISCYFYFLDRFLFSKNNVEAHSFRLNNHF